MCVHQSLEQIHYAPQNPHFDDEFDLHVLLVDPPAETQVSSHQQTRDCSILLLAVDEKQPDMRLFFVEVACTRLLFTSQYVPSRTSWRLASFCCAEMSPKARSHPNLRWPTLLPPKVCSDAHLTDSLRRTKKHITRCLATRVILVRHTRSLGSSTQRHTIVVYSFLIQKSLTKKSATLPILQLAQSPPSARP